MGYSSKFYGHDVLRAPPSEDRALVGNYQTLGYMKDGRIVTLSPGRKVAIEPLPAELGLPAASGIPAERLQDEAISLYQSASALYTSGMLNDEARNRVAPPRPIKAAYEPGKAEKPAR
jgi:hypothetical protein